MVVIRKNVALQYPNDFAKWTNRKQMQWLKLNTVSERERKRIEKRNMYANPQSVTKNIKSMKGLDYASANGNNKILGLKKPSSIPNFKVKQKNKIKKRRKKQREKQKKKANIHIFLYPNRDITLIVKM